MSALVSHGLVSAGLISAGQDPRYASPGVPAFLVIFFLAIATWLLVRSMVGHLRKVRYSAEAAERREAAASTEQAAVGAAAREASEPGSDGGSGTAGGSGAGPEPGARPGPGQGGKRPGGRR